MAQMKRFQRCGRPSLWRWPGAAAASALWRCTSQGWRLGCGGWLGLGLVWLGALAGPAQDAAAQADNRKIEAQVNIPYALQYGFGSYDVGGLSVYTLRIPVPHTFTLDRRRSRGDWCSPAARATVTPPSTRAVRLTEMTGEPASLRRQRAATASTAAHWPCGGESARSARPTRGGSARGCAGPCISISSGAIG